ncbi:inositol-pentakisphosphate 2-kinase [Microplitis mediator]|uniref:inositol-pentakisphosphate 2-kinase n=1 Tax=Microplitis mediator TaxID=375433 RepID=UPI002553367E|nr:inositol-pentakisphosphate 2-kinase [Microplitis mediator]
MDEMEVGELDDIDGCCYRGEGNANLVISLPAARSVLRFRKIKSPDELPADGGRSRVEFEYKFYKEIITKYLGNFVKEPKIIKYHPRDIPHWNKRIEPHRSGHRRHKSLFEEYGTILPDYTLLPLELEGKIRGEKPTFCVEIKPKQGFVPEADRHVQRCPYCVNQFYKLAKKTISRRSGYCPCDLFSGDTSRVKRAIDALVETPQNNFIVFKNGQRVWAEGYERMELERLLAEWFSNGSSHDIQRLYEDLSHLLSEALLREFPVGKDDDDDDGPTSLLDPIKQVQAIPVLVEQQHQLDRETINKAAINFNLLNEACDFPRGNLPQGSVLNRIYRMQQLHCISSDIVYAIYSMYSSIVDEQMVYFPSTNDTAKQSFSSTSTSERICNDKTLNKTTIALLRNYLLFSIARDCSILLSFREIDLESANNIPSEHVIKFSQQQRYFSFSIGITDVDPKNLNRIEKHRERTIRALNSVTVD